MFYDASTKDVFYAGNSLLIYEVDEDSDVVFKASFTILEDLKCQGTVTALFDLVVLGNIECKKIDVKGRLVCLGNCEVEESVIVQNEMWVNDISATSIVCHDKINAQEIDSEVIKADGNIVVGKILAVEDTAETFQNIICGETAYGAGKLVANTIVTAEELDLDDGEEALESPFVFKPSNGAGNSLMGELDDYIKENDYLGYFKALNSIKEGSDASSLDRALKVFKVMNKAYPNGIADFRDVTLLLWLIEASKSDYFTAWPQIHNWLKTVIEHFDNLIHGREISQKQPQQANEINVGNVVLHSSFGKGIVTELQDGGKYAQVEFEEVGTKLFPLPNSIKFLKILSQKEGMSSSEIRNLIVCDISSYDDWLVALSVLNTNKVILGEDLYNAIYDLLLSQIGLKTKYIKDRLREKGWD